MSIYYCRYRYEDFRWTETPCESLMCRDGTVHGSVDCSEAGMMSLLNAMRLAWEELQGHGSISEAMDILNDAHHHVTRVDLDD